MNVVETKIDELTREFRVAVPAADIERRCDERFVSIARSIKLPGFRPGRVPVAMVRKKYSEAVKHEVLEETINETSRAVISERGLRPALEPRVSMNETAETGDLEYTMAVELLPDVSIPDFSEIALERLVADVDATQIDATLGHLADAMRGMIDVEARPAASGDIIVLENRGEADGVLFKDNTEATIEIGGAGSFPGLDEQLVGVSPSEVKTLAITYPADFSDPVLANQTRTVTVSVKQLRAWQATEIDDELAKRFGLESVDELRDRISQQHGQELASLSRQYLKRKLLDALAERVAFALPKGLVDHELQAILRQMKDGRESAQAEGAATEAAHDDDHEHDHDHDHDHDHSQCGHDHHHEQAAATEGFSESELAEFRALAERRVRLGLLLAEVGRSNNVQVTPEETSMAIMTAARRYPGQERQVVEYFRNEPGAREALNAPLLEEKVVDFILERVKLEERKVSAEDLRHIEETEEARSNPQSDAGHDEVTAEATTDTVLDAKES